jgi:hypothetical protein
MSLLLFILAALTFKMAIFLVDLEFREKAKSLLTSRELAACIFLLLLSLLPWSEVTK